MKRSIKNIINIIIIVAMLAANGLTIYYAKANSAVQPNDIQMSESSNMTDDNSSTSPEMPSGDNNTNGETPPEKPDGDSSGAGGNSSQDTDSATPPEKPDGDSGGAENNSSQNTDSETPPEKPDGDSSGAEDNSSQDTDSETLPEKPDGEDNNAQSSDGEEMNAPENMQMGTDQSSKIGTLYYILFGIESLILAAAIMYFIMSGANKKGIKETFKVADKIIIYILSIVIITAALTTADAFTANKLVSGSNQGAQIGGDNASSDDAAGATEVEDTEELNGTYTSSTADENAILVKNGGNLTLTDAIITKTGDSSNTESSEFYGINAGILVTEGSTATISGANISTDAAGSNAVFATGTDAKIYISDSTVTTTGGSSARGLDATYGGYIEADNVTITTQGGSCAALATDRGEGTVIAKNSKLETNGAGSPVIYSTGDISISNTTGTANAAQMVVVEGKNSATVENSTLVCSGAGNRNNVDDCGIMIYQSMSGDANEGTGNFTSKNSSLSIDSNSSYYKTAPMFFVTNTDAVINLENTKLSFASNILLSAKGTDEWGNNGSNGGNVTLNATKQELSGIIELDNISSLEMNLISSSYKGTINANNSAKSVALTLDKNSTITLTGDSYVTSLDNADSSNSNINFNGYTLYVDGKAVNSN